jgi:hypothetical protein
VFILYTGSWIPDPYFFHPYTDPDLGSRGQKSSGYPDPDSQHWKTAKQIAADFCPDVIGTMKQFEERNEFVLDAMFFLAC